MINKINCIDQRVRDVCVVGMRSFSHKYILRATINFRCIPYYNIITVIINTIRS